MKRRNWVAWVVKELGGVVKAAAAAGTTVPSMYKWQRDGWVRLSQPALLLAATIHPDEPDEQLRLAWRLAGLEK